MPHDADQAMNRANAHARLSVVAYKVAHAPHAQSICTGEVALADYSLDLRQRIASRSASGCAGEASMPMLPAPLLPTRPPQAELICRRCAGSCLRADLPSRK